jgi:hypothetical protein
VFATKRPRPLVMVAPTITGTPTALDLQRKISVKEAAALNNVSEDTFKRHYSHLIKKISPRRAVVALSDALAVGDANSA